VTTPAQRENVERKLDSLPTSPGVYVFLGPGGKVLYVGKARSLRSRVRQYFQPGSSDTRFFALRLPEEAVDLETFVVANEKEAALLENAMIKERQPLYNFKLRDDKEFLSLRLDPKQAWPRLGVVRRPASDGARYFGPYDSATSARRTLRLVNRHFKLRTCTDTEMAARVRPCLQHQIQRCLAPCVYDVDREEYLAQARLVGLFLDGRHDELVKDLDQRMRDAAQVLAYERAAQYRDQLRSVERVREDQRVATARDVDQDAIGLFVEGDRGELALVEVRGGRVANVRTFPFESVSLPDDELLAAFVRDRYADRSELPDEILVPMALEAMDGLAEMLSEGRPRKLKIREPQRGSGRDLVAMATENAAHAFKEKRRAEDDIEGRLADVQKRLRLPKLPRRIECIDISHSGGTDTVASMTALENGLPDRKRYKSFHLRTVSGGDDFGAMREVLTRRLVRRDEPGWELPDLLVVDGGKGQLEIAIAVMRELNVIDLPVCGLAKEKPNTKGEISPERVFLPGQKNAIPLRERSATLHFLGTVRDEAHRTSNLLRIRLGKRKRLRSGLEDIVGIGKKTRTLLLKNLGSLKAIAAADREALEKAGASRSQAESILGYFRVAPPEANAEAQESAELVDAEDVAVDGAFEHAFEGEGQEDEGVEVQEIEITELELSEPEPDPASS
jgi:excinuclease ABC subunit C